MSKTIELLAALDSGVLNALANKLGIVSTEARVPELIETLDRLISSDPERMLHHLSQNELMSLAEAASGTSGFVSTGGGMPAAAIARETALEQFGEVPATYVPPESWRRKESRPIHTHEGERTVFPELRSVLKLLQAGKLKVMDKSGRATAETVALIGEALAAQDFQLEPPQTETTRNTEPAGAVRAHAWAVVVQQCGWAKARSGSLILTDSGRGMLTSRDMRQFAAGIERFMADGKFDEFNRINHIRGQFASGRRHLTPPGKRRTAVSDSIRNWPVNFWISFDEAASQAQATGRRFEVTDSGHTLYFGEVQYGMLGGDNRELNRQYLRAVLLESFATLGLIDVAYCYPHSLWPEFGDSWGTGELDFCSRYDGLLYVRLNALGAYCFGVSQIYKPPVAHVAANLRVLPTNEIVLTDAAQPTAADRQMLELIASRKSEFAWTLDGGRILSHLEAGGSVDDVLRFLESNSNDPIPENVETMLSGVASAATAILGTEAALLIEVRDESTAALIAHNNHTGRYCYLAGAKRLAVPRKNVRAFRSAVRKLGFVVPSGRLP